MKPGKKKQRGAGTKTAQKGFVITQGGGGNAASSHDRRRRKTGGGETRLGTKENKSKPQDKGGKKGEQRHKKNVGPGKGGVCRPSDSLREEGLGWTGGGESPPRTEGRGGKTGGPFGKNRFSLLVGATSVEKN